LLCPSFRGAAISTASPLKNIYGVTLQKVPA
jgi:hypothetical protein